MTTNIVVGDAAVYHMDKHIPCCLGCAAWAPPRLPLPVHLRCCFWRHWSLALAFSPSLALSRSLPSLSLPPSLPFSMYACIYLVLGAYTLRTRSVRGASFACSQSRVQLAAFCQTHISWQRKRCSGTTFARAHHHIYRSSCSSAAGKGGGWWEGGLVASEAVGSWHESAAGAYDLHLCGHTHFAGCA